MNAYCERCQRDDFCLCNLPDDPTAAAVEILDAARYQITLGDDDGADLAIIAARMEVLDHAIVHLQGADSAAPDVDQRR
jgi:hypothetical protein